LTLASELIKLNNLQLAGRLVSDELMLGIHGSKRTGSGVEFEQYRHYFPGDDLKRIDWKLYARSGKYLVKESSTESNLNVNLVLDLSGSMNYEENGVSRLQYAKVLLASLAYIGYRQGDDMSLYGLKEGGLETLVNAGKSSFHKILYSLEQVQASGIWNNENPRFPQFQTKQKEITILVSDFLQVGDEWLKLIKSIANPKRQILIFQVLGEEELNFNLSGFYRFKDLETGKEMELEAESVKKDFKEASLNYIKKLDEELQLANVDLIRVSLKDSISEVISVALKRIR
jgi:uncharacterized protein (DUF58 family)